MREIFQLSENLPRFYKSNVSENVLIDFNNDDVLYIIGIVDIKVIEGKIETWGFTMTVDSPITTLYSSGMHGLISITSADGQKATVLLEKSHTEKWKTFMNEYMPNFNVFNVNGTRLTPPKLIIELEEQLGCWFDLSKTPISNQRLIIQEEWHGFIEELYDRPVGQPIKVLLAGYKNSGKSTTMRYFINKCLMKWDKILVLDFDIGQSEFTIPGCISASIINTPLLGPNFTHLTQPFKSYFFGSNDPTTNISYYNEIVEQIVNDIKTNNLHQLPCFINTMGFVEGPGLEILYNLISVISPSDVIQLKFNEIQNLNLHSDIINDNTKSILSYNLWYFTSIVKNKLAKAPYLPNIDKRSRQILITTSYFSKCLSSTNIYFNDVVPYKINICNINIQINDVEEFTQDESLDIINANVIALCISTSTNLCECVGFGIVRCVNKSTGDVFVVTPVALDLLYLVNQFKIGNVHLPSTFYTKSTQTVKYACVNQDNIFNENITRHYKVML